ncbi:MAG: MFS transporter [Firmicutes bacterium]|nr:MFS transporter [Bacillota bacterium]
MTPFMSSSVNVALPSISKELGMSAVALNWVALSYTLSTAVFTLPFGRAADILGRKKMMIWGVTMLTAVSALCGFALNPAMLITGRILQGISGATISVNSVSILTSAYPSDERGKVLGLNVAMTYAGLSTGPYLGGLLTTNLGWRSVFFCTVPVGIVLLALLLAIKEEWAGAPGESFDYRGALIYGISLIGIVWGFSIIHTAWGIALMAVGLLAALTFVLFEKKVKDPILDISLLRYNKVFSFSSLAALIHYSATSAISYLFSLYLQYIKGFDPAQAGLILIAQPLMMALFSPLAGRISDSIAPQKVASLGMAITGLSLLSFTFFNADTPIALIVGSLLVLGFGFALFSSPNTNAVMSSVEKKHYGIASGILGASRTLGQSLSMGIASLVMVLYVGGKQISTHNLAKFLTGFKATFIIMTILSIAGIFASLARVKASPAGNEKTQSSQQE